MQSYTQMHGGNSLGTNNAFNLSKSLISKDFGYNEHDDRG